jgi:hypothetical protein
MIYKSLYLHKKYLTQIIGLENGRNGKMNKIKKIEAITMLVIVLALTISTVGMANAAYSGAVNFRAYVDGSDYVYIQGGGATVWYEHRNFALPGKWNGANEPTYIDGDSWYPDWSTDPLSDKYDSPLPHPTAEWSITSLVVNDGRGAVTIEEYPSSSNDYTAKILVDDDLLGGPDWHEFTLNWETQSPFVLPEYGLMGAVVSLAACIVAFVGYTRIKQQKTKL